MMAFLGQLGGSTPQLNRYPEIPGPKRLFHSERDIALIIDKTVREGYGPLKGGTVMALTAAQDLVPFVPIRADVDVGGIGSLGVSFLVADAAATSLKVSIADSYRYKVGDVVSVASVDNAALQDDKAISAIDRTDARYATITVASLTHANLTVANKAYMYLYGAATAKYLLDQDIDTGYGEGALGANTSVVLSNAVIYRYSCFNLSAAAVAILGSTDGQFLIMK